jgi:HEAT repeat protein
MRSEMYALAEIGSSAVIPLIELIRGAEAASKRSSHEVPAYRIQVRAARVLGEIGDARALPVLRTLLKQKRDVMVGRAIEAIKQKNRRKK